MADDGLSLLGLTRLEDESHSQVLGARTAKSQLVGEVAAQRARDEEQRLAVLDRRAELAMRTCEHRRPPRHELVRLEPTRELHRVPPVAAKLTLELARSDRRD